MDVSLKPEQVRFIQSQIASGKYQSVDDAINDAIQWMEARERRLEQLRQDIAEGTEQLANGQMTDGEIVFARLQEKIKRIAESEE